VAGRRVTQNERRRVARRLTTACTRPANSGNVIRYTWRSLSCARRVLPGVRRGGASVESYNDK
jgi:hypothetical protein